MMETKNMELKPCPFCGGKDVILATVPAWPRPYYELICRDCNAVIQAKDKESVHDLWNRRYEPPNEPLTLDELREMDGEPVWNDTEKYWSIVDTNNGWAINRVGKCRPLGDLYYRRRPEEGVK